MVAIGGFYGGIRDKQVREGDGKHYIYRKSISNYSKLMMQML